MPFLFLGLLSEERQDETLRDGVSKPSNPTSSQSASQNGQSVRAEELPDQPEQESALPPSIEELRRRLSEKHYRPASPLTASVESLQLSDRRGIPTFSTFKFGYVPTRGLLLSAIGHELAIFGLFLLFTYVLPGVRPQKLIVRLNTQDHVVYLPEVGGGSEGQRSPGGGESAPQQPSAAPARASRGFAYSGPQAILSDPPNPTNAFQTIQRPLLVHPEPLRKLVPLPNIVQMAETRLPSDLVAPKPAFPQLKETPKAIRVRQDSTTHREAKWKIPVTDAPTIEAKAEMPKLPAAEEPLPEAPKFEQLKPEEETREVEKPSPKPIKVTAEKRAEKAERQVAPPSPAQVARVEMHGKAKEPLLSLSPMPLPAGPNVNVPAGEARGRFAIAPDGTLNPNSINPGKPNGTPSISPGTGQENSHAPNAAAEVASNAGTGAGHNPAAGGGSGNAKEASGAGSAGTGTGSGNTSGGGAGGTGSGKGRGANGKGMGSSGGRGPGTGAGEGNGSGSGSFPGITIQGGEDASANGDRRSLTVEPQANYGMTVVSTASSGGGLEDFGVFNDERVFTVYIPMKRSPEEVDPTWTLQYALVKNNSAADDQQVNPPVAVMREWPQVPAELERKYAQRQVVISAVIDEEGRVHNIKVKQTPDPHVSDAIAQAFAKWVFRPAQLNGQPIAVKILLGIPL